MKPIKCSVQEVVTEAFAALNLLTVDVTRTPQHCSMRLSRQKELKSVSYVKASSSPEEKTEIIMNVGRRGVENKTSNVCGLSVKTSQFKGDDFCGNLFSLLHFPTYIIGLSKRLVSSFSKLGTLFASFLKVP